MGLKIKISSFKLQNPLIVLLLWMIVGAILRFLNLTAKPPWTDEFATLVLSLGNSFIPVPLDRAISLDTLLQPLQIDGTTTAATVIHRLLSEDNHPPLYFVLAHWWMQLFPSDGGYVNLWAARSLPALFGVLSIPAIYGLSWLAFRSNLVAQLAAAMMAVSPYGVFIAQEARHYTLAILWVIASLSCLVLSLRHLERKTSIPYWLILSWIAVNTLGIATHYFFSLTLAAEAIVVGFWLWGKRQIPPFSFFLVAAGTLAGALVWLPEWRSTYGSEMTHWIYAQSRSGFEWLNPIFQLLAAWFTMVSLLPIEAEALPVVIFSAVLMVIFFYWSLPIFYRGIKENRSQLGVRVLGGFVLGAIALFLVLTYFLGTDITKGARYNFVYFPAVISLVGVTLSYCWQQPRIRGMKGKKAVAIILIVGFLSGITITNNLGYRKYYRPDKFIPIIQQQSSSPILIATTHRSLVHTGEMMGIALEIKRKNIPINPQFLLAHQTTDPKTSTLALQQTLAKLPRPLDLWIVNFYAPLEISNCAADSQSLPGVYGYDYKLYHCQ